MTVSFQISAQLRGDTGKGASRRLRRQDLIPGIIYGGHETPTMISLSHSKLLLQLENPGFYSHLLDIQLGDTQEKVVLKALQRHPAKPFLLHADFQRVRSDEALRMRVPLRFINEAICPGVKLGGTVSHHVLDVEITCLPQDLPEYIDVDAKDMGVAAVLHLSELKMPAGVALARKPDPDLAVVSIQGGGQVVAETETKTETKGKGAAKKKK